MAKRTGGSSVARKTLTYLGLDCFKLYTQQRANDRTYKIYGSYNGHDLARLQQELIRNGARNVRPVQAIIGNRNAGIKFEY